VSNLLQYNDSKLYYYNSFVDRDMMVRYSGYGIGHQDEESLMKEQPARDDPGEDSDESEDGGADEDNGQLEGHGDYSDKDLTHFNSNSEGEDSEGEDSDSEGEESDVESDGQGDYSD
jgi:hypothetical protein